jgi:hypothetical protein
MSDGPQAQYCPGGAAADGEVTAIALKKND